MSDIWKKAYDEYLSKSATHDEDAAMRHAYKVEAEKRTGVMK